MISNVHTILIIKNWRWPLFIFFKNRLRRAFIVAIKWHVHAKFWIKLMPHGCENRFNFCKFTYDIVNIKKNLEKNDWFKWLAIVSQPTLWGKCEDETHTPKSGNFESSMTLATSELDSRGQNTSPWGVLYTVGKVLKFKCWKWPRMSHLDICSTSYGQKKGRESNWQFDSRPQKVGNRPDPVCVDGVQHAVEKLLRRLHPNPRSELGVMSSQSPGSPNWDSFETPP